jgi:hypothetical protein
MSPWVPSPIRPSTMRVKPARSGKLAIVTSITVVFTGEF